MDMSRVSACTYPLIDRPPEKAMEIIAAAGFKKIDLLGRLPHLSLDPDECDPAVLKAAAEARGLQIANLGTYVGRGFASDDPVEQERALEEVRRAIDLAVFFGSRSIRVFAGNDEPECIDRIVPWYRRSAEYAAQKKVYMGVENHGGGISGRPELCKELADKVGSPFFGVLYEPYNLMAAGTDYRSALEIVKDHIVHTHFKDGVHTDKGVVLTMLGQGEIDFSWIMGRLNVLGYRGDMALEYELQVEPPDTGLKKWYQAFAVR
jgi:sugar phosphate isomerase/epimerase